MLTFGYSYIITRSASEATGRSAALASLDQPKETSWVPYKKPFLQAAVWRIDAKAGLRPAGLAGQESLAWTTGGVISHVRRSERRRITMWRGYLSVDV